ncbi:MAG TPA: hypothetical protein VN152_07715 [Sphingopyxis sp.]|nr:hypothetical protein [Sphingopyxis sp.]
MPFGPFGPRHEEFCHAHCISAAVFASALCLSFPASASDKSWDDAGSIARDALVVAAFGVPAVQGDWDGALQAGGSMGVAAGMSYGLKEIFPERRPDSSDNKSFPSGHASISFAAAATLPRQAGPCTCDDPGAFGS